MYKRFVLASLALALSSCCLASFAQDQAPPPVPAPRPMLTVTGDGEVQGKPDIAYVTVGVQTEDKDAAKAAALNATANAAVIAAILKTGVAKADMQTVNYSVSPIAEYKNNVAKTVGYRVSNDVRVKVRDLAKVGAVVDAALAAGANAFQGVSFAIDNDSPLRKEALAKAAKDAEQKADVLADALGFHLSNWPLSVTEGGSMPPPMPIMLGAARAEMAPAPTTILPGEMRVTARVTVVYGITP